MMTTMMMTQLQPETKLQELQGRLTMMVRFCQTICINILTDVFSDEDDDEDYIESFFDGILGDDDGKKRLRNQSINDNY